MNDIYERAFKWLFSSDTGMSSKALCAHMLGIKLFEHPSVPMDAADRGRCIGLLQLIPEWIPRLDEMKKYKPERYTIFNNGGMHEETKGWAEQVELIKSEFILSEVN